MVLYHYWWRSWHCDNSVFYITAYVEVIGICGNLTSIPCDHWCCPSIWYGSPDSKVHGANMGPTWGRQDPGGPHVGPMNLAIWESPLSSKITGLWLQINTCYRGKPPLFSFLFQRQPVIWGFVTHKMEKGYSCVQICGRGSFHGVFSSLGSYLLETCKFLVMYIVPNWW